MSRDGFRLGDFDPHFPLDDKFMALAAVVPDRQTYFEATGVYWHVVAAAWRDGVRKKALKVAPGASLIAVEALQQAGLLDGEFMVPEQTFANWIGVAARRREEWAEKKRAQRLSSVSGTPSAVRGTPRDGRRVPTGQVQVQDRTGGVQGGNGTLAPPTDGECRVCGSWMTDKDLCRVGPGWIEHSEHPGDAVVGGSA